jgi:heptosyltransferase-1
VTAPLPPRAVLIVRLSALGDVVVAAPLASALRRAHPDARLAWLVEDRFAGAIEGHPALDRVMVFPRARLRELRRSGRWITLLREVRAFLRELRSAGPFDLALDVQGLLKSAFLAYLSGARVRVGLGSREGSGLLMTRVNRRRRDSRRIGSQYRALLESMGIAPGEFLPELFPGEEGRREAALLLAETGLEGRFAALCPFTTRPQKHWRPDGWAEVARGLAERGLSIAVLGGPGDREAARKLVSSFPPGSVDLAGRTTVKGAAAVIERSALLAGVDTGLTHFGVALGVPTVALFLSTSPYLDAGRPQAVVLYHPRNCSPCRRRPACGGAFPCREDVAAAEVLAAADRLAGLR